ncbi:MAG: copper chaperone PCu(A)C [Chloroflexi bacterium]|nr:copper chaperone PCu(A)C [Chloroflexota bacterium]
MWKWFVIVSLALTFLMVLPVAGQMETVVYISSAWVRATVAAPVAEATAETGGMAMHSEATPEIGGMSMGGVSAAYMTIENPGTSALRLVGAATTAANIVEIHEVTMENDVMRMRPLENGLEIPAGGSVELKLGGYHVMLMDLTREFVPGEAISLTLTFEALNAEGTPGGTVQEVVIGAPIREEAPAPNSLIFVNAWARPTVAATMGEATAEPMHTGGMETTAEAPMGGMSADSVSAAYMQIMNRGETADRLVSATTSAANLVEIHEVVMENDVMKMRPLENGLEIAAGGSVELKPGGYHIMLMELTREFVPGEAITLTLKFESGAEIEIGVPIEDRMAME